MALISFYSKYEIVIHESVYKRLIIFVTENLAQFYEMFYNITDNILFCVYEKLD